MNFEFLVNTIQDTHNSLQKSAVKAVNVHLTLRNWLVGFYIVEYEQKGEDRAKYGQKLLPELTKAINVKGLSETTLILCRQFYFIYPQIGQSAINQLKQYDFQLKAIPQLTSEEFQHAKIENITIPQTVTEEFKS